MGQKLVFAVLALCGAIASTSARADQIFPPENINECQAGSPLSWTGPGHAVRCDNETAQVLPSGTVLAFDLKECPKGWYPMPDMGGRTIVGAGQSEDGKTYNVGDTGGHNELGLQVPNMPRHSHLIRYTSVPDDSSLASIWIGEMQKKGYLEFDYLGLNSKGENGLSLVPDPDRAYAHNLFAANGDGKGPYATAGATGGTAELGDGEAVPFDNRQAYHALLMCRKSKPTSSIPPCNPQTGADCNNELQNGTP